MKDKAKPRWMLSSHTIQTTMPNLRADSAISMFRVRLREVSKIFVKIGFTQEALAVFVILASSLVSLTWLDGKVIFFWDTILPFRPDSALGFGAYTWGQNFGEGTPQLPFEFGAYLVSYTVLHTFMGFSLAASQQMIVTSLFLASGLTMFMLLRTLHPNCDSKMCVAARLSGALFYMFNFYTVYYLIADMFPSWWLYAFLPLSLTILLLGMKAASEDRDTRVYVLSQVFLFFLMSTGFWEPPYLVYSLFLFVLVSGAWCSAYLRPISINARRQVRRFVALTISCVLASGLWWLYGVIYYASFFLSNVSAAGAYSTAFAHIQFQLRYSGSAFTSLLTTLSIYPWQVSANGSFYDWQVLYFTAPWQLLFVALGTVTSTIVLLPSLELQRSPRRRFAVLLYAGLSFLIFFAMQGSNPILRWIVPTLTIDAPRLASLFYATNLQFALFPIVFILAFFLSQGLESFYRISKKLVGAPSLSSSHAGHPSIFRRYQARVHRAAPVFAIATVALLIVVLLPWFAWGSSAIPTYRPGNNSETVPGVTNLPRSLVELGTFINENGGSSVTLFLPLSYNFNSLSYNGTNFIDTGSPSYLTGTPTILGESGSRGLSDQLYGGLAALLSSPILPTDTLDNVLTSLDIKFVVVNTEPGTIGAFAWFNASLIREEFANQSGLPLVATFGPYLVYENLEGTRLVSASRAQYFSPSIARPVGETGNLIPNMIVNSGAPTLPLEAEKAADNLTLLYKYTSPFNDVWWNLNLSPSPINLSRYNYLLLTFETTNSNTTIQLQTQSLFTASDVAYGKTILRPLNPSRPVGDWLSQSSPTLYTIAYPLYNQTYNWYSSPLQMNKSGPQLYDIRLSLSLFGTPTAGKTYAVTFTSITAATAIQTGDLFTFLSHQPDGYSHDISLVETNLSGMNSTSIKTLPGIVSFHEVNPTDYNVDVSGAQGPFLLVFRQTFESSWVAYAEGMELPETDHFVGDGYDNVWLINRTGSFVISLVYAPQRVFNVIIVASVVCTVIMVASAALKSLPGQRKRVWLRRKGRVLPGVSTGSVRMRVRNLDGRCSGQDICPPELTTHLDPPRRGSLGQGRCPAPSTSRQTAPRERCARRRRL